MSKCPNCGVEVEQGMKFCGECGAKMPTVKLCPKCGAEMPEALKFCGECGYSFAGKPDRNGGLSMGDKNVIAGDVIGRKEDYHVSGNATFIKSEDETKRVVQCFACGRHVRVTESFACPKCSNVVCVECYDKTAGACARCSSEAEVSSLLTRCDEMDSGLLDAERVLKGMVLSDLTLRARRGDYRAQFLVGHDALQGEKDVAKGCELLLRAANAGSALAQYAIARYREEQGAGWLEIEGLYQKAADQGLACARQHIEKRQNDDRRRNEKEAQCKAAALKELEQARDGMIRQLLGKEIIGVEIPFFSLNLKVGKTPITQGFWHAMMGDNPSEFKSEAHPVESITYAECHEFIRRLNENKIVKTLGIRFRLPTAEESALFLTIGDGHMCFTKSEKQMPVEKVGWICTNSGLRTHEVGQLSSNRFGLYDVRGNVWEWTSLENDEKAVCVGAGWGSDLAEAENSCLLPHGCVWREKDVRASDVGFRLVADV